MADNIITPTPENPIPDVDEIKPGIPTPAWPDEGGGGSTGGGVLVVHEDDNSTLDKTWNEIATALSTGTIVIFAGLDEYDGSILSAWSVIIGTVRKDSDSAYNVYFWGNISEPNYIATSADGYPVANEE